jgi:hypothetical protein
MAPRLPTAWSAGTGGDLAREVEKAEKLKEAISNAKKEIIDTFGKTLVKEGKSAKDAYAEVQVVLTSVAQELKKTTTNAKEYGEAVKKDTEAVLAFAKQHNIALADALAMYKKIKGPQEKFVNKLTDKTANWALGFFTLGSAALVYKNRVTEMREGQQLFLSEAQLTGKGAQQSWSKLQTTVDQYRKTQRDASVIAHRYGISTEEVQEAQKGLAKELRGTIADQSKLSGILEKYTERNYQFSRVMGVDVKEAQDFYINQIRQQGQSHEEADKSLGIMITSYDRLAEKVGKLSIVHKDEYLAVIKDIQSQMGPTQVSMSALTGGMAAFAEVAKNAGMNAKQTQEFMGTLPKIAKGIPRFFKQQLGSGLMREFERDSDAFIKKMTVGESKQKVRMITAQLEAIKQSGKPIWDQQEEFQDALYGTKEGLAATLSVVTKHAKIMPAYAAKMLGDMGIPPDQVTALLAAMRTGKLDVNKLKAQMDAQAEKAKEDPRKALNENLVKNSGNLDANTMRMEELRGQTERLAKKTQELVPVISSLVGVIRISNMIQGAGGMLSVSKALVSKFGSMGGAVKGVVGGVNAWGGALKLSVGSIAKFAGGAAAAGLAGYAFGSWLDDTFGLSDKFSDAMANDDKRRSKERRGEARGQEFLKDQSARIKLQAERIRKYGRSQITDTKGEHVEATAETVRLKEFGFLKKSLKQGEISQQQFETLVRELDKSLKDFPTPKKMVEAQKPNQQRKVIQLQQYKAAKQEDQARALMQSGLPLWAVNRAQVPGQAVAPAAAASSGSTTASTSLDAAPPAGISGNQQPAQQNYNPATGTWILQISTRDPAYQQMMQQSVATAQRSNKRAR